MTRRAGAHKINAMSEKKQRQQINTFTAVFQKVRGGYTTWVEEMPNVISEGKTKAEAKTNLKDALMLMLETNRIMSEKEAVGESLERSTISLSVHPVA